MRIRKRSRLSVWWRAFRHHFVSLSIFLATLGGLISWVVDKEKSLWYFSLVLVGVIINRFGLNMTGDYYDFRQSVDRLKPEEKNPYTRGMQNSVKVFPDGWDGKGESSIQ